MAVLPGTDENLGGSIVGLMDDYVRAGYGGPRGVGGYLGLRDRNIKLQGA